MSRTLVLRFAVPTICVALIAALAAVAVPGTAAAHDDRQSEGCTLASLRGDYGILVSGVRFSALGLESFVGTAIHSYDGMGHFTAADHTHGGLTGADDDDQITGTYSVNADCSGTPKGPVVIESSFVIVDRGREIDEAVMSPQPNLVTAVQHRIR